MRQTIDHSKLTAFSSSYIVVFSRGLLTLALLVRDPALLEVNLSTEDYRGDL